MWVVAFSVQISLFAKITYYIARRCRRTARSTSRDRALLLVCMRQMKVRPSVFLSRVHDLLKIGMP